MPTIEKNNHSNIKQLWDIQKATNGPLSFNPIHKSHTNMRNGPKICFLRKQSFQGHQNSNKKYAATFTLTSK